MADDPWKPPPAARRPDPAVRFNAGEGGVCVFFVFVPFVASLLLVARPGAPSSLTYNYLEIVLFQSFWESLTWILAVRASASQCVCV